MRIVVFYLIWKECRFFFPEIVWNILFSFDFHVSCVVVGAGNTFVCCLQSTKISVQYLEPKLSNNESTEI